MKDKVELGALYKKKDNKELCIEEYISPYVRVTELISNPLEKDKWYVEFIYCFKDDLESTTRLYPVKFLPYDVFLEYFDYDLSNQEVNAIIFKKMKEKER